MSDHVTMQKNAAGHQVAKCEACGEELVFQFPIQLVHFVALGRQFTRTHEKCKSKKKRKDQDNGM